MARISTKIPKVYRYLFYLTLSLCWCSGVTFWLLHNFGMVEGEFGTEPHWLQYPALQAHGFAAFVMLMCLGALFTAHVPATWPMAKAKKTGLTMLVSVSLSVLSAYSLYYLVSEDWKVWLGNGHAGLGVVLPLLLFIHIKVARRNRLRRAVNYS